MTIPISDNDFWEYPVFSEQKLNGIQFTRET